jgi:hypothetical protein
MPLINERSWKEAAGYVDNYLATGDINRQGQTAKPEPSTPERVIVYFTDMFEQIIKERAGDDPAKREKAIAATHISTGTGGMLVALLDRHPDRAKAQRIASQILNEGSITLSSGQVIPLGVDNSPCSRKALRDFINQQGIFAGRQ